MNKKKYLLFGVLFMMLTGIAGYFLLDNSRVIHVTVSLNNPQAGFSQDWPVYVYAAVPGTKLPLSSYQTKISKLPLTVTLTEEMYLLPTHTMAGHDQLVVVAKISSSGNPHQAGPEDLSGGSDALDFTRQTTHRIAITLGAD